MSKRRNHKAAFKAQMALEGVTGTCTVSELAVERGVLPTIIQQWKRSMLRGAAGIVGRVGKAAIVGEVGEETVRDLYAMIVR